MCHSQVNPEEELLRPVDTHMQQPPSGGIWVDITCVLSKSNCKLSDYHYSDSIIFDNTMQVLPGEWLHVSDDQEEDDLPSSSLCSFRSCKQPSSRVQTCSCFFNSAGLSINGLNIQRKATIELSLQFADEIFTGYQERTRHDSMEKKKCTDGSNGTPTRTGNGTGNYTYLAVPAL
uniref:Uncharacterized protein n=1 Tax=Vespula pensylvanica TaxID=30213 RepID=A0A834N9R9_VESPE|nr:hypothetical protein H0235_015351 [Vespula pensylvanica]